MNKFCVGLVLFLLPLAVGAEDLPEVVQNFGGWSVRCMASDAKDCSAVIGGKFSERPGYWVKMGFYIKDGETHLIVRTHLLVSEHKTVPLNVDNTQLGLLYPECFEKYCETDVHLRPSDLAKIKTGKDFIVSFRVPPSVQGVALYIPLLGAAEALQFIEQRQHL